MPINNNREEFTNNILENLGAGVIQINATQKQVDNAINTAFKGFWLKHHDGSYENFYTFLVTDDDVAKGFIVLPQDVEAVTEVLPHGFSPSQGNFANFEWQLTAASMSTANGINSGSFTSQPGSGPGSTFGGNTYSDIRGNYTQITLSDFFLAQQQIQYLRQMIGSDTKLYSFARHLRRLTPRFKFKSGDMIVCKVFENINPESADPDKAAAAVYVWDDPWFIEYATAQVKLVWASSLKKFGSVVMPGGVVLEGQTLYDEAKSDILRMENDLLDMNPTMFLVG